MPYAAGVDSSNYSVASEDKQIIQLVAIYRVRFGLPQDETG